MGADLTMRGWRSLLPAIIVFTALYAALSLSVTNSYYQLVMTLVPIWAIFGLSWNLLSGYTGLISFGHAAFFGVGGLCRRARPDPFRHHAVDLHSACGHRSAASPDC